MTIFDDLEAEQQRLDEILAGLDEPQWAAPSLAEGWTVADVVLHLAQSEEAVIFSTADARAARAPQAASPGQNMADRPDGLSVDDFAAEAVRAERDNSAAVLARWRQGRTAALA